VRVFEKDGYTEPEPKNGDPVNSDEVFTGISNGRATINAGKRLPTGTYYYIVNYRTSSSTKKRKAGFLYLQQ